ncbi:DUF1552 domain-containing protein [bacterium]|nr:DUF1552 domain-containing protein [bacterium]
MKDRENVASVLDVIAGDLRVLSTRLPSEDKALLDKHATFVRETEAELKRAAEQKMQRPAPVLEQGVSSENDDIPRAFAMQADLLVNAFVNDMARVATLQFTNSVGQARFRWLGIEEGHHSLSHDPDLNEGSQEKLVKMNVWLCEQVASLARKLEAIPEPGFDGTMLDHTPILWTNELGKGNSHTLDNIPFVLVGGGLGFKMGRALKFENVAHNRLWLAVARAFGHELDTFGSKKLSDGGPLELA